MLATVIRVTCDGDPGDPPDSCPSTPVHGSTHDEASVLARLIGWSIGVRDGLQVDLCPYHPPRQPLLLGRL